MRSIILILTAMVSMSVTASPTSREFMEKMDTDDDGFITLREAVKDKELLRAFGKIDTNEDGKISEQELVRSDYGRKVLAISA